MNKKCYRCEQVKDETSFYKNSSRKDGLSSECKKCRHEMTMTKDKKYTAKYMREYLAKNPEQREKAYKYNREYMKKYKDRNLAHTRLFRAIKSGKVIRLPCEICGDTNSEAHHWHGYDEEHQLDVQWLCSSHHALADRAKKYKKADKS